MENSSVFIIINNNNPMLQIIASSQCKNGSVVAIKFNTELTTVSVIYVQKFFKVKITIQKYEKATGLPFVDTV